jgi:hypothetical protein
MHRFLKFSRAVSSSLDDEDSREFLLELGLVLVGFGLLLKSKHQYPASSDFRHEIL